MQKAVTWTSVSQHHRLFFSYLSPIWMNKHKDIPISYGHGIHSFGYVIEYSSESTIEKHYVSKISMPPVGDKWKNKCLSSWIDLLTALKNPNYDPYRCFVICAEAYSNSNDGKTLHRLKPSRYHTIRLYWLSTTPKVA